MEEVHPTSKNKKEALMLCARMKEEAPGRRKKEEDKKATRMSLSALFLTL